MNTAGSALWVSPQVLDWAAARVPGGFKHDREITRAHEIWAHADERLRVQGDSLTRVDAITTLKRAINQRLAFLDGIYAFDHMPVKAPGHRPLEQLAFWGVVRPTMLRRLVSIRNAVEHEDAEPPDLERCLEFLDAVWYFLRSTDRLCREYDVAVLLFQPEGERELELTTGREVQWNITLSGSVPKELQSTEEHSGWMQMRRQKAAARITECTDGYDAEREARLDAIMRETGHLEAILVGPETYVEKALRLYFSAS